MPKVQAVNRRALIMSADLQALIDKPVVGAFVVSMERLPHKTFEQPTYVSVMYLMVPGQEEPELVKLYMARTSSRWDEPGNIVAWDWNHRAPTLLGGIQTEHWLGYMKNGRLISAPENQHAD